MTGFNAPDLRLLLEQDGHTLKKEGGEFVTHCPFHDDGAKPNLHINLRKQVFVCRSCGAGGGVVDYLVKRRGMTMKEAGAVFHGEEDAPAGTGKPAERRPPPPREEDKPRLIDKLPARHDGQWEYRSAEGTLRYVVQRYDGDPHPTKQGKTQKRFGQYSPVVVKKGDKRIRAWQVGLRMRDDRPLYRLPEILAQMEENPKRGVNVVEGEKCADLFRTAMPKAIVTTSSGGAQAYRLADWTPLMGKNVVIFADADTGGHNAARWLADHLGPHCPIVTMVLPDPEGSEYPDCGDALEDGGATTLQAWMKKYAVRWKRQQPEEPPPHDEEPDHVREGPAHGGKRKQPPPPPPENDSLGSNRWFHVLGNLGDRVLFKLRTNILMFVSRSGLTSPQTLISLAPDINWWTALLQLDNPQGGLSRAAAMGAGAGLLRYADEIGQIDLTAIKDRGVTLNIEGETVWNLGDSLLVNGAPKPMSYQDGNIYQAAPAIALGDTARPPMSLDERASIADMLLRYRWASQDDGRRMLGWIVTSVVGGLLDWRPHVWMLGQKDIGKSWIVKEVMMRIHASMAVRTSDATPAAIARRMGGASMPLYIDEAEPGRWWVPEVITLCRIASGADGERLRADASTGGINSQEPRFSACMSSTKMPAMEDADNSRFTLVRFSAQGVDDWPKLKASIMRTFAPPSTTPRDLRHAMVMDAPEIVDQARRLTAQFEGEGRAARDSMISAALTAGYAWWTGDDALVFNRTPLASQPEADARNVLMDLLGHRIRTKTGEDRSLLDHMRAEDSATELLESYGMKVLLHGLAILPRHPAIVRLLGRGTARGADLRSLLLQMDGVKRLDEPMRIGTMRARPIFVPSSVLEEMGIDFAATLPV